MQYTHTYILNIRITVGDDYDRGCTKNTLTALYTTDQQHVLACGTNLSWNNDRREVDQVLPSAACTGLWYIPPTEQPP